MKHEQQTLFTGMKVPVKTQRKKKERVPIILSSNCKMRYADGDMEFFHEHCKKDKMRSKCLGCEFFPVNEGL